MDKMLPLQEDFLDVTPEKSHCVPIAGSWQSDLELTDLRKQRVCMIKSRTSCRNQHKHYLCANPSWSRAVAHRNTSALLEPWAVPASQAHLGQDQPTQTHSAPSAQKLAACWDGSWQTAGHLQPLCCSKLPSVGCLLFTKGGSWSTEL